MGVSLSKPGANVSFDKELVRQQAANATDPAAAQQLNQLADALPEDGLKRVRVCLGWKPRTTTGAKFDLDASAILLSASGRVASDDDFVFYGHLQTADGNVKHNGDNLTGEGEGDDEIIDVNLLGLTADVDKIVFPVAIYEAESRSQSFGMVGDAFIRIVNADNGAELARYDLSEDAAGETVMVFGELYRNGEVWKFRAVGTGYDSGLRGLAKDYGVNV